jgi:signal transduction histidine kinase
MEANTQVRARRMESRFGRNFSTSAASRGSTFPTDLPGQAIDERLQRLERLAALGTASAGLAHEIKNAMVAIRTFVELLLARNKDAELAEVVRREVLRIDSIISQMLRTASQPKASLVRVELNEILDRSLGLIEPQLRARKIRLKRSYLAAHDAIQGDAHQLEQAFLNLLLNAFDAIGHDGQITVATCLIPTRRDTKNAVQRVQVRIHDTGSGIAKEQLAHLFEPFYSTKPNGTGLGLPITRDIIAQHRGTISVQSECKRGTTFEIALPLA